MCLRILRYAHNTSLDFHSTIFLFPQTEESVLARLAGDFILLPLHMIQHYLWENVLILVESLQTVVGWLFDLITYHGCM